MTRIGREAKMHLPFIGDGTMLANGGAMTESCRHLRMMKPPEGEVLQLISAILFTDNKVSYPTIGTIYYFLFRPYIIQRLMMNVFKYLDIELHNLEPLPFSGLLWHTTDPA